jgi:G:T-mismatch repair DNA endonuclease (very short patch repair protein)
MKNTYQKMTEEDLRIRREKTIKTCREKYGTDFSQQNADIKKKQSDTWHSKSKEETNETTKRRKKTCIEKYGVDHVMKSQEILEEVRQRHLKENGYYHWIQKNVEHKDIYMDDEKFKQFVMAKYEEDGHKKVKKTELDNFFNVDVIGKCKALNLMDYIEVRRSPLEEMIKKLLDENGVKYEWRNRSIIDGPNGKSHGLELDLYLPDYRIGIEINDLANHSVNPIRNAGLIANNREYHLYKTKNCSEKGVRLIHIWEWELKKNFEKLSRWLLNELDNSKKKVFARKCEVKAVSPDEEKQFLDEFHLQGYSKSETCYGLYFNDELLQVMSFVKSRYDKKYQHEILRLCTKNGYAVVGGAARLLNHFIKEKDPESIISYCDYSKFNGSSYEKIGMKLEKLSKPTAYYCNFDMHVINESMLMRYGVDSILGTDYGKGTDNKELIMKHGYLPVYNCGNLIFTWHKGLN